MKRILEGFASYAVIVIATTVIHWQLFFIFRIALEMSQAYSNLLAFGTAASLSFYANALYTFAMPPTVERYLVSMAWLGSMSLAAGTLGDRWALPALVTLTMFSLVNLIVGFLICKWLVFRVPDRDGPESSSSQVDP